MVALAVIGVVVDPEIMGAAALVVDLLAQAAQMAIRAVKVILIATRVGLRLVFLVEHQLIRLTVLGGQPTTLHRLFHLLLGRKQIKSVATMAALALLCLYIMDENHDFLYSN